jgi:hypothetical protein
MLHWEQKIVGLKVYAVGVCARAHAVSCPELHVGFGGFWEDGRILTRD